MQKRQIEAFLFALALTSAYSTQIWAQSININLGDYPPVQSDNVEFTENGVNFKFIQNVSPLGASIYRNDTRYGDQSLYITSTTKPITAIEFEGDETVEPGGDGDGDSNLDDGKTYEQHYVKVKTLPTDGQAVTMAIVGDTKFRNALAPYIEWN